MKDYSQYRLQCVRKRAIEDSGQLNTSAVLQHVSNAPDNGMDATFWHLRAVKTVTDASSAYQRHSGDCDPAGLWQTRSFLQGTENCPFVHPVVRLHSDNRFISRISVLC